ncbi:HDIG domain-containing protein [candidate division WWE3 bacterium]|nr:HDIG domain-containing protein [candidate division WWE3 bacterium]
MINREEAQALLEEHVTDEYQLLHAFMVASAMEAYAEELGEDADVWFLTGLLHDLDYEEFPEEHPMRSIHWLSDEDVPEELLHAIEAHAYLRTGVEPETNLAAALIAVDELSGFMYAYSLMRPSGFEGMKASKVVKKLKDKAFAAKISREDIYYGVEKFEVDMKEHINFLLGVFNDLPELEK